MKRVTLIGGSAPAARRRTRVAAYCRVSKDTDRLNGSFDNQVGYYTSLIEGNPEWEFAGVYSDHGVSGLRKERREGFKRLIEDCERGAIDVVLTKSISRFARNTVDLLETVRRLKALGVDVRFEREGISTLSAEGEVVLTLLAAFAQLESESTSENIKWAIRRRMADGVTNGRHRVYGYRWEDFALVVEDREAGVVRRVFEEFASGSTTAEIVRGLNADGVASPGGTSWNKATVDYIIENRAYVGELHLQKFFVSDPVKGTKSRNRGELPQYIVEGHHEPIVPPDLFERASALIAERRRLGWRANPSLNLSPLSGLVKCSVCGRSYGRGSVHASGAAYWSCMSAKDGSPCMSPAAYIREDVLVSAIGAALRTDRLDEKAAPAISRIEAHPDKSIDIVLADGTVRRASCARDGRKDWPEERRAAKSEQVLAHAAKGEGRYYPFTTRIRCKRCGAAFEHKFNTTKARGKVGRWRHSGDVSEGCALHGIDDERLRGACGEVLGMDEFDGKSFMAMVERIEVDEEMNLAFLLKDGGERAYAYGSHGRARNLPNRDAEKGAERR